MGAEVMIHGRHLLQRGGGLGGGFRGGEHTQSFHGKLGFKTIWARWYLPVELVPAPGVINYEGVDQGPVP